MILHEADIHSDEIESVRLRVIQPGRNARQQIPQAGCEWVHIIANALLCTRRPTTRRSSRNGKDGSRVVSVAEPIVNVKLLNVISEEILQLAKHIDVVR